VCVALLLLSACGDKDVDASGDTDGELPAEGDACNPEDELEGAACVDTLACEPSGDGHVCAAALEIRGIVLDAASAAPLEGARVTALDATGSPVSSVALSDTEGRYMLRVRAARDDEGQPVPDAVWTLFVTANDYQPFPGGLRPALPLSAADVELAGDGGDDDDDDDDGAEESRRWVLENPSTNVELLALPEDQRGGRTISGTVHGDHPGGTLVVAEGGGSPNRYTVADADGHYAIFNVPQGAHDIVGYRGGLDVRPTSVDGDADLDDVDLESADEASAAVTGSVNIVDAPGGSETSVVLVPVSVYNDGLERGPVPVGLRAPQAPAAPSIAGAFEIPGVPPGRYKVLAAFENDALVRDPDAAIAGTAVVEIEVETTNVEVGESFKVTEGLEVVSPGAEAPEEVSGTPLFVFADDSSEDRYELIVLDAYGDTVWQDLEVPGVSGSSVVEVEYGGPALVPGAYYQFRATSIRENPNAVSAISRTEDLRGVFIAR